MSWDGIVFVHLPDQSEAVPAGRLSLLEEGLQSVGSTFGYGARYLKRANAIPVDPVSLPLSSVPGEEQLYEPPAGLALFGAIRDAAPDFWGRRVIEAKLKVPPNSVPESTYLLNAGTHRFGALDFRESTSSASAEGLLPQLTDLQYLLEAADRVQEGLPIPARLEMLFQVASLGGARPKVLVSHDGKQFLAKFPAKNDPFDIPAVERACLELARACGLNVPRTDLVRLADGRNVMLIERFDRAVLSDGSFSRKHCVSALTMLGKHEQESLASSYSEIAQVISARGVSGHVQEDRAELYARVAFNILISNDDDHLRNHAFIWHPPGKAWRLSPLYDVVPRPQVSQERRLHLSVGPQGRSATLTNLFEARGSFGLLRPQAIAIIERVSAAVREWRTHLESAGVSPAQCDLIQTAFRRPRDIGLDEITKTR
ncbi:MAG TPA: HipA domain-containing protein [Steroidobacteraceae bacterium]|nr:HipA domain-containing protein [Steroidobacteraceae bacterium]